MNNGFELVDGLSEGFSVCDDLLDVTHGVGSMVLWVCFIFLRTNIRVYRFVYVRTGNHDVSRESSGPSVLFPCVFAG